MDFKEAIKSLDVIIENGPLGTRLKYDYGFKLPFCFTGKNEEKKALTEIYKGDIAVAQQFKIPLILNAATFRTSKNHLCATLFKTQDDFRRINITCINFIKALRNNCTDLCSPIFIGAPLGSMYDAYSTSTTPPVEEALAYHKEQINIFKELKVDFINAITLPSLSEAIGISLAAERADVNYTIGFILNRNGTLLDGHALDEAIQIIDKEVVKKPLGYLITCTPLSVISNLIKFPEKYSRLIGAQPNGSNLPPEELALLDKPVSDSPKKFTKDLMRLKAILQLKIIGGCCGTTREHLKSLAEACSKNVSYDVGYSCSNGK